MILVYRTLTVIWVLVIMMVTLTPGPNLPSLPHWELMNFDTFVHAAIFALLVFLMFNASKAKVYSLSIYTLIAVVIFSVCFGAALEVIQRYIPGRNFDYYDILSNSIGCVIGVVLILLQFMMRRSTRKV